MPGLRKEITVARGITLAVTMVIGSGILGLPGLALEMGSPNEALAGWILISVGMVPMVYIFLDLGVRFSSAAGLSRYAVEAVGDWGGYAVTYLMCGSVLLGMPALAHIGGSYMARLLGAPESMTVPLSLLLVGVTVVSNLLGVRTTSLLNSVSLGALFLLLAIMVFANTGFLWEGSKAAASTFGGQVQLSPGALWKICALLFWVFLGWENLSFGLEEFRDPGKTIPRVYWGSFILVVSLYLLLAIASVGAELSGNSVKGAAGMANLIPGSRSGSRTLLAITVLVMVANTNAWVFSISRMLFAAGREGSLPRMLGNLDRRGIPVNSLLAMLGVFSAVIVLAPFLGLSVSTRILFVSQNFIVLFVLSIVAFWRVNSGWRRWIFSLGGAGASLFLLSGFSFLALFPASLLGLGYFVHARSRRAGPVNGRR